MTAEFKRGNLKYQAQNPLQPTFVDTGVEASPQSIERLNNSEPADEDVLRRPHEQIRRRTEHLKEELNTLTNMSVFNQGKLIDTRGSTVTWNGLSVSAPDKGVFTLSGPIYVAHPMYPSTRYELPSAVIGNSGVGFFSSEHNRLLEEGDSLWIVWGDIVDSPKEIDVKARITSTSATAIAQHQLRKGPTWVLFRTLDDVTTDYGAIVPGVDVVRVYPDFAGDPSEYIDRTIKAVYPTDADGYSYVEVDATTPFWKTSPASFEIPSIASTNKLSRGVTSDTRYEIIGKSPERPIHSFCSNLWFYKAGTTSPMLPDSPSISYRDGEFLFATPLCTVQDGKLFFPLAASSGVAAGTATAPHGFVRLNQTDRVPAGHIWANKQTFEVSPSSALMNLKSNTLSLDGNTDFDLIVEEAHTNGIAGNMWLSPARPGSLGFVGNVSANPFLKISEQGHCNSSLTETAPENSISLQLQATPGDPTSGGAGEYAELRASKINYIPSIDTNSFMHMSLEFPMQRSIFFDAVTSPVPPWNADRGLKVTNFTGDEFITVGELNKYETVKGWHFLTVNGTMDFSEMHSPFLNLDVPAPLGTLTGDISEGRCLSLPFNCTFLAAPGTNPTDPLQLAMVSSNHLFDSGAYPEIYQAIVNAHAGTDTGVGYTSQIKTIRRGNVLKADGGNQNTSYPASPVSTNRLIIQQCLFSTDLRTWETGPTVTFYKKHSQILAKLVAYPEYHAGTQTHRIYFYMQYEFHTDFGDVSEADRLGNHQFISEFFNINGTTKSNADITPRFILNMSLEHKKVWRD